VSFIFIKNEAFPTLVAISDSEKEVGLMWRKWPPPIMCFPYSTSEIRKFWMKNTISPLDIVFCKDNKIVSICYGQPLSTAMIGPNDPTNLIIEFPYGTVSNYNIKIGDEVKLQLSKEAVMRDINNIFSKIL